MVVVIPLSATLPSGRERHGSPVRFFPRLLGLCNLPVAFFLGAVGLGFVVFMLGLPGRIAIARNHPEAETIETLRADWRSLAMTRMLQLLSIIHGLSL
jgi:hypothetical protein